MRSLDGDTTSLDSVGVVMNGSTEPEEVAGYGGGAARKKSPAADATAYRVYRQRWMVLLTVVLLNISNAGVSAVTWEALFYLLIFIIHENILLAFFMSKLFTLFPSESLPFTILPS